MIFSTGSSDLNGPKHARAVHNRVTMDLKPQRRLPTLAEVGAAVSSSLLPLDKNYLLVTPNRASEAGQKSVCDALADAMAGSGSRLSLKSRPISLPVSRLRLRFARAGSRAVCGRPCPLSLPGLRLCCGAALSCGRTGCGWSLPPGAASSRPCAASVQWSSARRLMPRSMSAYARGWMQGGPPPGWPSLPLFPVTLAKRRRWL